MRHSKHDIFPSHFSGLTKEESEKLEEDLLKHITQADGFESFEAMEKGASLPELRRFPHRPARIPRKSHDDQTVFLP